MKTFISVVSTLNRTSNNLTICKSMAGKTETLTQEELDELVKAGVVKEVSKTVGSMLTITFYNGVI